MKRFPYLLTLAAGVLLSASSYAQEFSYKGLNYLLEDGVVCVGYNSDADGDIIIPGSVRYEGVSYPVSGIGDGAFSWAAVSSVDIPNTVTFIGQQAFCGCYNMTSVSIPSSVRTISDYAFDNSGLVSVTIPGSVETLGCGVFQGNGNLVEAVIGEGVKVIPDNLFANCWSLADVTLPDGLEEIGADAFSYCPNLSDIRLPDGVRYIGDNAFNGCPITSVNLTEGLEYLGGWSFAGTRLREVTIPDGLDQIQWGAFLDCKEMTDVTVGKDVTFIDTSAFGGLEAIENFTLADSDASLSLSGMGVFGGSPVKNLMLGRQVHGSWFLQSGLETVSFSGGCRTVAGFDQAQMLKKIYFAPEVETISEKAFSGSVRITDVICGGEVPSALDETAFIDYVYKNAMLDVPEGYEETYHMTDGWSRFAMINGSYASVEAIDMRNPHDVFTVSGILVGKGMTADEILRLPPGVYIVDGCKVRIR